MVAPTKRQKTSSDISTPPSLLRRATEPQRDAVGAADIEGFYKKSDKIKKEKGRDRSHAFSCDTN